MKENIMDKKNKQIAEYLLGIPLGIAFYIEWKSAAIMFIIWWISNCIKLLPDVHERTDHE